MSEVVRILNAVFGGALDLLLWPLQNVAPVWALVIVSAIAGIILILIYRLVSNQAALRDVKRAIYASLLESVLYRHSVKLCLKAQGRMFGSAFKYFFLALRPLVILAIPCLLLLAQLNLYFGTKPFKVGDVALVGVDLAPSTSPLDLKLNTPEGVQSEAVVRMPSLNRIEWRVKALQEGSQSIAITTLNGESVGQKPIIVGAHFGPIVGSGYTTWWKQLLYPLRENGIKLEGAINSIWISYPEQDYKLAGVHMHWLVIFCIISIISGLIGAKYFGVEI